MWKWRKGRSFSAAETREPSSTKPMQETKVKTEQSIIQKQSIIQQQSIIQLTFGVRYAVDGRSTVDVFQRGAVVSVGMILWPKRRPHT